MDDGGIEQLWEIRCCSLYLFCFVYFFREVFVTEKGGDLMEGDRVERADEC